MSINYFKQKKYLKIKKSMIEYINKIEEREMIKKVILSIVIIFVILISGIFGYFFLVDIESKVPEGYEEVKVETNSFMGRKIFTISPKESEKSKKVILYFHGGAYVAEASNKHWDFLKKLVQDTKSTVIMPDYPLTPKYTYKDVLNMVQPLYKDTLSKLKEQQELIVMGDSAGGGIALGLVEKLSANNIDLPSKTILISPWLDISMSNNKIDEAQKNDKDLDKGRLTLAGMLYSKNLNKEEEYFVSPVKGNLSKLKNIFIYTGTYDILNPDCYILKEKAKEVGVDIEIKEYETAPHIWIVNNNDDLAKKAYQDLIEVVNQ